MLRNHIKLALRNFWKFKYYSGINLLGMTLGLSAGLLILLFVLDELSYDEFHANKSRIYKIVTASPGGGIETNAWPIAEKLVTEFPEIEKVVYSRRMPSNMMVTFKGNRYAHEAFYAGEDFFKIFSFDFIEGNPANALTNPYSVVITREVKERYFSSNVALGQTLTLRDSIDFVISGVIENVPSQSHIQFDILASFSTYEQLDPGFSYSEGWGNFNVRNYALLDESADYRQVSEKIKGLYRDNIGEWMDEMGVDFSVELIPLKDVYLRSRFANGFGPTGSFDQLKLISAIGIFIVLLACINFVNMATARSVFRAREVGIKKLVGSGRWHLFWQFIVESLALTLVAFIVVLSLIDLILPFFNAIVGKEYMFGALLNFEVIVGAIVLILVMTFLSGYYPAIVLSGMNSIEAIRGRLQSSKRGVQLRRALVVVQFSISAALVLGTIFITDQLNYMKNQDLGFDKEQILVVDATNAASGNSNAFKNAIISSSSVAQVSFSNALPGRPGWQGQWAFPEQVVEDQHVDTEYMAVDENYVETLGLEIITGRNFELDRSTDLSDGLLINETTVREMGWETAADAIGKRIVSPSRHPEGTVIGVVKDYHGIGLQHEIWPKVMDYSSADYGRYFALRFETGNTSALIEQVQERWEEVYGDAPFDYFFLDSDFDKQYRAEEQLMQVFILFAAIGLTIACIGLLGMISFMVGARMKEVCIRKVHGAKVSGIAMLLSKEFLVLVVISNIIVIGPVWYYGNMWLNDFAYHTIISPGAFIATLITMLVMAFATVSYQTFSAAFINPAKLLRND